MLRALNRISSDEVNVSATLQLKTKTNHKIGKKIFRVASLGLADFYSLASESGPYESQSEKRVTECEIIAKVKVIKADQNSHAARSIQLDRCDLIQPLLNSMTFDNEGVIGAFNCKSGSQGEYLVGGFKTSSNPKSTTASSGSVGVSGTSN